MDRAAFLTARFDCIIWWPEQDSDMEALGSPIKRHLSREKSIPTVRGVSSSPSVVRLGVGETNQ
jgi:hypothetical protein